ncbi:fluoride efflux transporter CrcB [Cytobacillus depressus]|uniref:Fluoride-specific ion channel FluC n=1 Tax=Cytobacillus depressus TaxID=1602942 RepID=A0A6L3V024_9BACI|nr:fluoride efflux transporter CrcB [Cytobacillus depressus]KAB2330232.1 fluoride efflux transporter CrcB [Cytobacillus depressus]
MIIHLLLIAIGGFLGAIARFKVSQLLKEPLLGKIPLGTLTVNLIGSFLLGLIIGSSGDKDIYYLFGTGFMGAFTTFSTLNLEAVKLIQSKERLPAILYIVITYTFGIFFAFIGYFVGK